MKNLFALLIVLLPVVLQAQTERKATEKYCGRSITGKLFSKKIVVRVDYGTDSTAMKLKPAKEDEILKSFTNVTDVLNYITEQGWQLVTSVTPKRAGQQAHITSFLKRSF